MEEFYRVISQRAKIEKGGQVIEFVEEWDNGLEEWDTNEAPNLENPADDYDSDDNHELDEVKQANIAIGENQLRNLQYELIQGDGKFSKAVGKL